MVSAELDPNVSSEWDELDEADQRSLLADVLTGSANDLHAARVHVHLTYSDEKELRPCLLWAAAGVGLWSE